jgi:hypothetical protein
MRRHGWWLLAGLVLAGCGGDGLDVAAGESPVVQDDAATTTRGGQAAGAMAGDALAAPTTEAPTSDDAPLPPASEVTLADADEFCARVAIYLVTASGTDHPTPAQVEELATAGEDLSRTATDLATSADPAVLARLAGCVNDLAGHLPG